MKTWFITGASRGLGREWVKAALQRGDNVAAAARRTETLAELVEEFGDRLLPVTLDVNDREAAFAAVQAAHAHFGRLDVVVNNAGYGLFGMIEEVSETEARAQIETNLFGALWVTQAALPFLREQGSGHVLQVSSIGGIGAFPNLGLYHASKWGLEGFSEALSQEVAPFGIRVTLIEPGGFSTDWGGSSSIHAGTLPAYDAVRERQYADFAGMEFGDPAATSAAILAVADAENPPLRLLLGKFATHFAPQIYAGRLKEWADWEEVARKADGS